MTKFYLSFELGVKKITFMAALTSLLAISCSKDDSAPEKDPEPIEEPTVHEHVILLNEGNWQSDNGQLSYIFDGCITNKWFKTINGEKLGDTPQDIVLVNDNLVAISVNWSNIIQYIRPDGTAVAQTENIPNCRAMCTDSNGKYLYITSYAHETALGEEYTKGYVAKVDVSTYQVISTCEVGYEPEGIAWYNGKLYIANTGGYAFSEGHDYEHTVSIVDADQMTLIENVELKDGNGNNIVNLYGEMSQCGKYLCINSPGDYMTTGASTVIFNCEDKSYRVYDVPSTYNTTIKGDKFFAIGSSFSFTTYNYEFYVRTIDPVTGNIVEGYIRPDGTLDTDMINKVAAMTSPYCTYQNPYTGHLYITDAGSYGGSGNVYEYDLEGNQINEMQCYMNPGHMIALPDRCYNE